MVDHLIYSTSNLSGLEIVAECNPGGGTSCPCDSTDVDLESHDTWGEVIANVNKRNTWVNAIAVKKFADRYPDEELVDLRKYYLEFDTKLPVLPRPYVDQEQNPQAADWNMGIYDGQNRFGRGAKRDLGAPFAWMLNPWTPEGSKGKIFVTARSGYVDTGLSIHPRIGLVRWSHIRIEADFEIEKFIGITVNDQSKSLSNLELPVRTMPNWGTEVSGYAQVEGHPSWPQSDCQFLFWWNQYYKNYEWGWIES